MIEIISFPGQYRGAKVVGARESHPARLILELGGNRTEILETDVKTVCVPFFLENLLGAASKLEPEGRAEATFNTLVEEARIARMAVESGLHADWFQDDKVGLQAMYFILSTLESDASPAVIGRRKTLREISVEAQEYDREILGRAVTYLRALETGLHWMKGANQDWTPRLESMLARASREANEAYAVWAKAQEPGEIADPKAYEDAKAAGIITEIPQGTEQ